MHILTIQSIELDIGTRVYADISKCRLPDAIDVYKRLFDDYNKKNNTNYESFFWGFSNLLTDNFDMAIKRAREMIGKYDGRALVLDIPDELCLETDFYNFSAEIFAHKYPDELESYWDSIYDKRNSEKQVIFPYIDPEMIIMSLDL